MTSISPRGEPGTASFEDGLVLLDRPDGVAVAILPGAAAETGPRLIAAAEKALAAGAGGLR